MLRNLPAAKMGREVVAPLCHWIFLGFGILLTQNYHFVRTQRCDPATGVLCGQNLSAPPKARVIVIGAGAAGIAATQHLLDKGFDVVFLEASNRLGGRLWTIQVPGGWVEVGGQWVRGNNTILYDLTKSNGFQKPAVNDNLGVLKENFGLLQGADFQEYLTISGQISKIALDFTATTDVEKQPTSVGTFAQNKYRQFRSTLGTTTTGDQLFDLFHRVQKSATKADSLFDVGTEHFTNAVSSGDHQINLNVPYSVVLDVLGPDAVRRVQLNNYVKAIRLNTGPLSTSPMQVVTQNGNTYFADHVILTASLGHLKENLNTLFQPPLDLAKQDLIRSAGFGTYGKMTLVYEQSWWNNIKANMKNWLMEFNDQESVQPFTEKRFGDNHWTRSISQFLENPTVPNAIMCLVAGKNAELAERLPDDVVMNDVTELLRRFAGPAVPRPMMIFRGKWSTNELIRGCSSYVSIDMARRGFSLDNLADPAYPYNQATANGGVRTIPGLLFAGEATYKTALATVHGAIISGFREADRISALYV